ncbi:MAG: hypothetical protein E6J20_02230 [Chloroflexi bacterium]|nr:MAG: hypothetical protein E6J20_02230 [Chloroflexota bacterium]
MAQPIPGTSCSLFPADSVFNADISKLPVHSQSATWMGNMTQHSNLHPDLGTFAQWYGIPINVAPPPTSGRTPTFLYNSESDHPTEGYPIDQNTFIEGGPGASSGSDRHALVVSSTLCKLYEIYNLQNFTSGQTPQAGSGAVWNLSSDAMRPIGWTSADAAGLPMAPLLLRPDEILAGSIAHAIRFTAHCTHGYIWPGSHDAGSCDSSFPPMGARFRLRANFDISGFSANTQVVLRAFQRYGMILADNGSDWFFGGTTDNWWGTTAGGMVVSELKNIPAAQFDAVDESGMQAAPGSYAALSCAGTPLFTSYFSWFDKASAGMVNDNIHLLNTGGSMSTGCLSLGGVSVPFNVAAGQETYLSFPAGTIGGPVVVSVLSGPAVLASQRVQYYQSFNEVWAMSPSQAATTSYLSWFDKASTGMVGDNIHVLNPGSVVAHVIASLTGATPIAFTLAAGAETYASFPAGTIGGPVVVTADQAVLASQRVQYYQTFNEVVARGAARASMTSYFNWFDKASAGMVGDNIHLLNTGGSPAHITVGMPGTSPVVVTLAPLAETYVTFAAGKIGGPVTVTSDQPVLSSQRVQYNQSFNETPSESAAQAQTSSHIMWFDKTSAGMLNDNIHVLNTSGLPASVTVKLGTSSDVFTLPAGMETYVSFPAGNIGGPVTITSSQPVLAAQRVQYFQTFNEVPAA